MRVLVVGNERWAVAQAERALRGHEVRRCHEPEAPAFPCAKFCGGSCPVEDGVDVVALVRGRHSSEVLPGELGAVCGLRADVPVVAAGMVEGSPFADLVTATVPPGGRLAEACQSVAVLDVRVG